MGGGGIVANRYLNSMGGSLVGTSVLTTSLIFVNNLSKKFIAKELYCYYNLSFTLVSCIVICSNFQIMEKSVSKLNIKGVPTVLMYTISGKAFLVLTLSYLGGDEFRLPGRLSLITP